MSSKNKHIPFTKMQGTGNDFVVFDNRGIELTKEQIIELTPEICNRKFGVGSDGILALMSPEHSEVDYTMFYRNSDGSDAGMCGNGARCMALFAHSLDFDAMQTFNVHDCIYRASIKNANLVHIAFPMKTSVEELTIDDNHFFAIHTGTEHIIRVIEKEMLKNEDLLIEQGHYLRYHPHFEPKGTNVNFISGIDNTSLELQTYERGVENLTLACGTGAIASALVWHHLQANNSLSQKCRVQTKGGILTVYFSFDEQTQTYSNIKLEGAAHFVFKGEFTI